MIDQEQERHEMSLVKTHESGVDEWYCSICGRRFLLEWPPTYKKIILEPGNEFAIHSGGKGGLEIGAPQLKNQPEISVQEAARLDQWEEWLVQMGFEDHWSGDT